MVVLLGPLVVVTGFTEVVVVDDADKVVPGSSFSDGCRPRGSEKNPVIYLFISLFSSKFTENIVYC